MLFFQVANHAKRTLSPFQTVCCKILMALVSLALPTLTRVMTRNVTLTLPTVKFTMTQPAKLAILTTIHQAMACIVT